MRIDTRTPVAESQWYALAACIVAEMKSNNTKTTRLQIPRVHGLPVARRLALLGPLRARLRDARAVGLAALTIIIITITIGHLEPELEELLEAADGFRLGT